ncbi:hypothetical protein [Vibrio alginolyticus]|uniref:hypothetical protein n=1 Tax=Vibrio alginolyticus TaxID=663 RepID=UPI0006A75E4E|nr:hypothetical protein [Vibrio alginolyticus]
MNVKLTGFLFYAPLLGLAVCLVFVGFFVVGKNLLLRDVVFSYSALIAAFVMFILNLYFSLNTNTEKSQSTVTSFITHRDNSLSILSLKDQKEELGVPFELEKREHFSRYYGIPHHLRTHPQSVEDRHALFDKLYGVAKTIYLGDLLYNLPDWNPKKQSITEGGATTFRIKAEASGNDTFYSVKELIEKGKLNFPPQLLAPFIGEGLTLPPNTHIQGDRNTLRLQNPFVTVIIHFAINLNYDWNMKWRKDGSPYTVLDGKPVEYIVYTMRPTFSVTYNKLYSGHRKRTRYQKWVTDLEAVFHHSFSTYSKDSPYYTG